MSKKIKRWLKTEQDKQLLFNYINSQELPMTVVIQKGVIEKRTSDQNRLQRLWLQEAEEQGDMTAEEYRGHCKLHFGIPILRNADDDYKEQYDRLVKPHSYPQKLIFMQVPHCYPVTSLMTVKQKHKFLIMMYEHFTFLGFKLTIPNDIRWQPYEDNQ